MLHEINRGFACVIIQVLCQTLQKLMQKENKMYRHYDFDKCSNSMKSFRNTSIGDVAKLWNISLDTNASIHLLVMVNFTSIGTNIIYTFYRFWLSDPSIVC